MIKVQIRDEDNKISELVRAIIAGSRSIFARFADTATQHLYKSAP